MVGQANLQSHVAATTIFPDAPSDVSDHDDLIRPILLIFTRSRLLSTAG